MFKERMQTLRSKLKEANIDIAVITDDDSVYYYTGYYDYLHMDFGRPTILLVPKDSKSVLITPTVDVILAEDDAIVDHIEPWNDGVGNEWREVIPNMLNKSSCIAIELNQIPAIVRNYINSIVDQKKIIDVTPITSDMRMIKSDKELQLARHAGEVAMAMMKAGRSTIADGVPEYEVSLATSRAGTKKSSELLLNYYKGTRMSPMTHFLHIMASGETITMTHHRASNRIIKHGDPVFLCFCGMTNFHRFKLGFDRTFWVNEILDKSQEEAYKVAVESQTAALKLLHPGATAEEVHAAYAEVIKSSGYDYPMFRCGRSTGFSFLERPQLVNGDKTVLQPGMVFAVDGSVCIDNYRAQVGDSFIITEDGHEAITSFPKSVEEAIIN